MKIIQTPSPNFSLSTYKIIGVQIHKTLGLMPSTLAWLRNPKSFVSAHFLIAKDGTVYQLVQLTNRPWSSGRFNNPSVRGKKILEKNWFGRYIKPGHYLLQVEFECLLNENFTDLQYQSCIELFKQVLDFNVNEDNLITHQDTAIDKPNMEKERDKILELLVGNKDNNECTEISVDLKSERLNMKFVSGKLIVGKIKI